MAEPHGDFEVFSGDIHGEDGAKGLSDEQGQNSYSNSCCEHSIRLKARDRMLDKDYNYYGEAKRKKTKYKRLRIRI